MNGGTEFFFEGLPVGLFFGTAPRSNCEADYEAFRGPGHYLMGQAIEVEGKARCYYLDGEDAVSFDACRSGTGKKGLNVQNFSTAKFLGHPRSPLNPF